MTTTSLTITSENFQRFKLQYEQAAKNGEDVFKFDGHDVLTAYAEYLIEYVMEKGRV